MPADKGPIILAVMAGTGLALWFLNARKKRSADAVSASACCASAKCSDGAAATGKATSRGRVVMEPAFDAANKIEFSVLKCPPTQKEDFRLLLPGVDVSNLLLVLTFQPTALDMACFSEKTIAERDTRAAHFISWATEKLGHSLLDGSWSDIIDPRTAMPVRSQCGPTSFMELDDTPSFHTHSVITVGCCRIMSHHKWASKSFFGLALSTASPDLLVEALQSGM